MEGFARARPDLVRVVVILGGNRAAMELAAQDLRHGDALRGRALIDAIIDARGQAKMDADGGVAGVDRGATVAASVVGHERQYAARGPSPATRGAAGQGASRRRLPQRHQSPTAAPACQ